MLTVVVQDSHRPNRAGFKPSTLTTWAAISSLLFIQTVIISQGASQLFKFEQAAIAEAVEQEDPCVRWWLSGLSLLLQSHIICAFLFLVRVFPAGSFRDNTHTDIFVHIQEMVLAAHVPEVGWYGVATTTIFGFIALLLWFAQATGRKPIEA